jgi:ABC-2 type transport system ATP-binding protein
VLLFPPLGLLISCESQAEQYTTEVAPTSAMRCRNLVKRYGEVVAVDGLDLDVGPGECFGMLGPNGAGKTTTVEILEGLREPDGGEVELLGERWRGDGLALRARLGIQLQETKFPDKLTVVEVVTLFRSFYPGGLDVGDVLARVSLEEKADAYVRTLSGGQKQRLSLACALVGDPEIVFLDEPTTGLDPQSRRQTWDIVESLKARGRTVLLTTHYMEEAARLCDRVAVVDHGKVIALGTPRELIASLGAEHVIEFAVEGGGGGAVRRRAARPADGGRRGARRRHVATHRARGAPRRPGAARRAGRARHGAVAADDTPCHARGRVHVADRTEAARWLIAGCDIPCGDR